MSSLCALLLAGLASQEGEATAVGVADLQPTTYRSPSGEWEVLVDPDSPDGSGEAKYEIRRAGEVEWSGIHEATLWDAVVTDDGHTLGFGYSEGVHTWSGRLFVGLLDPEGAYATLEARQRGPSRYPDYTAVPSGIDLFQHPDLGLVVVVVGDRETVERGQQWRFFDVEKAQLRRGVRPKEFQRNPDELGDYLGAEPVLGTPLFLVHWAGFFPDDPVRFSLIGANGRPVWFLDRVDDLRGLGQAERRMGSNGLILESNEPATFALWHRSQGRQVRYGVEKVGAAWTVHELGRERLAPPEPELRDPGPEFSELNPVPLGSIDVSVPDTDLPAVHNVGAFAIVDDPARLAFLPADQRERPVHLTLVDAAGELVTRHDLDALVGNTGTWIDLDWDAAAGRFLLIRRIEEGSELWALDAATGATEEIPTGDLALSQVQALEQGFLVRHDGAVSAFDRKGRRRWQTIGRGMAPMGPERIAVLELDGTGISLLNHSGDQVGSIDLRIVRRGRLGEGTRLEPDVDDGLIFVDSGRRVARFRSDGSVASVFQAAYENGRLFRLAQSVQVGPQSRLWTSDSNTLLRLDADGVVDRRLGVGPGGRTGDSGTVAVGPGGQIYAVDKDSGVVRVLDQRGHHLFNCDPSAIAANRDPSLQDVHVSVEEAGAVLLSGREGVFLFSPEGRLARIEERGFDPIRETWYTLPGPGERLVVGQRRAFLIDAAGEVRRTIERRPDGRWLKNLYQASVAQDGTFALLAGASARAEGVPPGIHLFSATGDPLRTIWVPVDSETFPAVVYSGERVVYVDECVVHVFDAAGEPVGRFNLPGEPGLDHWQPLLPRHVNELWAFDREHTIERYELP